MSAVGERRVEGVMVDPVHEVARPSSSPACSKTSIAGSAKPGGRLAGAMFQYRIIYVDYTQLQDHAHIINATFLNPGGSKATSDVEGIEMMVSTGDQFVVREDEVDVLVIPGPCGKCGKLTLPLKPENPPALA